MKIEFFQLSVQNISAGFEKIFRAGKARNLDFGILSYNSLGKQEAERMKALLDMKEALSAAVSVGASRITGKGFMFSPKLPYVSTDGIIVNVKRCEELGIPERVKAVNTHSHFEDAGGIHATLLSFLEAVVPYGELYGYSDPGDVLVSVSFSEEITAKLLHPVKNLFGQVNYEIQKKYDKE